MIFTLIPKRIYGLLLQLNVNVTLLSTANTYEEVENILRRVPKYDKKVLYAINSMNDSIGLGLSEALGSLNQPCVHSIVKEYFTDVCTDSIRDTQDTKELMEYIEANESVKDIRDNISESTTIVIDDNIIKAVWVGDDGKKVKSALLSIQVYNEVVNTGRTPVNLIQHLLRYI